MRIEKSSFRFAVIAGRSRTLCGVVFILSVAGISAALRRTFLRRAVGRKCWQRVSHWGASRKRGGSARPNTEVASISGALRVFQASDLQLRHAVSLDAVSATHHCPCPTLCLSMLGKKRFLISW